MKKQENLSNLDIHTLLLKNNFDSDVSLIVGNAVLPAHKNILSARSEVFKRMFCVDMAENQKVNVKINDFDPEVIGAMHTFIYTHEVKNLSKISQELFRAAYTYGILDLQAKCEEYFLFNFNLKNVVSILNLAQMSGLKSLKKCAFVFVKKTRI